MHKFISVYGNHRLFRKPPLLGPPLSCAKGCSADGTLVRLPHRRTLAGFALAASESQKQTAWKELNKHKLQLI